MTEGATPYLQHKINKQTNKYIHAYINLQEKRQRAAYNFTSGHSLIVCKSRFRILVKIWHTISTAFHLAYAMYKNRNITAVQTERFVNTFQCISV